MNCKLRRFSLPVMPLVVLLVRKNVIILHVICIKSSGWLFYRLVEIWVNSYPLVLG